MLKFLLLVLLVFPKIAFAVPIITNTSGVFKHNSSATITGTGFGIKAQANPKYYDEFDRTPISTSANIGTWASVSQIDVNADVLRSSHSTQSAHKNFTGEAYCSVTPSTTTSPKWLVSYWVYLSSNWDWGYTSYGGAAQMLSNIKFPVRFWITSGQSNIYNSLHDSLAGTAQNNNEFALGGLQEFTDTSLSKNNLTKGVWHQFTQEFVDATEANSADCEWRLWWNGKKIFDRSGFACNATGQNMYPLFIGFYNAWGPPIDSQPNDMYMDDMYVDTTLQRIEICDTPTRNNATHCEMQLPSSWADDSITVQIKQGSFNNDTAYLYTYDAYGVVSNSVQLVFGTSESSTDFTPPTTSHNGNSRSPNAQIITLAPDETATTQYCIASASCTPSLTYSAPVSVKPGKFMCYKSTDSAGNQEQTRCQYYGFPVRCQ